MLRHILHTLSTLSLIAIAVGVVILCSRTTSPRFSAHEIPDNPNIRPAAFEAEEIFLPKSLLGKAEDTSLQEILRSRDVVRLDAYFDAEGLRDAWFVVRFRGIEADGSTWKSRDSNFECKRYHVHSSSMDEAENRFHNLEVLARVMSRELAKETDAILASGQAKDTTVSIIHFDRARIVPIPDHATSLKHVNKQHIDEWRRQAGLGN